MQLVIVPTWWSVVLLRLAYLTVTQAFDMAGLLPVSDRDKDAEIVALRHQITVFQRQFGKGRVWFTPGDRALLAALLYRLPSEVLRRVRLLVRPDTVLRWYRDLVARRHAAAFWPTARWGWTSRSSSGTRRMSGSCRSPSGGEWSRPSGS